MEEADFVLRCRAEDKALFDDAFLESCLVDFKAALIPTLEERALPAKDLMKLTAKLQGATLTMNGNPDRDLPAVPVEGRKGASW